MSNILIIILLSQLLFVDTQHVYFSDPDLSNPNIPQELRDSCGYRYGVINRQISYPKQCFLNSYSDQNITIPIKEGKRNVRLTNRVLRGRDVFYREAPWVVQIVSKEFTWYGTLKYINHWCTGVLITMKYILTAAHCWGEKLKATIYAGRDETTEGWRTNDMTWYLHPNYTRDKYPNGTIIENRGYDIAVIELTEPIDWQKYGKDENGMYLINTICLPIPEDFSDPKFENIFDSYRKATIFGWGRVWGYEVPRILQRGDYLVTYMLLYENLNFLSMTNLNQTRGCKGDSGSGLIQYIDEYETRAVLIGIHVASIKKKNIDNYPCDFEHVGEAFAVRVVNYLDWINGYLEKG